MITIAPLETIEELQRCEELQHAIWGFQDIAIVPSHMLLTSVKGGGILLGAFETSDSEKNISISGALVKQKSHALLPQQMIGFVFGFPSIEKNKLRHASLMCGVLSDNRFQGVGYDLKLAQREAVLKQELELITWTFDPLQSPNANFNFRKLGVLTNQYERNYYGNMRDRLNQGLDTDRLTVEWWLNSTRVRARVNLKKLPTSVQIMEGTQTVNQTRREKGFLVNRSSSLALKARRILIEVPYHIGAMKEKEMKLAQRWRKETREMFEAYFNRGYWVSEFATLELAGEKRSFYLLEEIERDQLLERM
jgi:predicted GNAT superfamily acetyltransferase